jgi:hypothetical protein
MSLILRTIAPVNVFAHCGHALIDDPPRHDILPASRHHLGTAKIPDIVKVTEYAASKCVAEDLERVISKGSVAAADFAGLGGAGLLDFILGLCRGLAFHRGHLRCLALLFFVFEYFSVACGWCCSEVT